MVKIIKNVISMFLPAILALIFLGFIFFSMGKAFKEQERVFKTYTITKVEEAGYGQGSYVTLSNGYLFSVVNKSKEYIPKVGEKLNVKFVREQIPRDLSKAEGNVEEFVTCLMFFKNLLIGFGLTFVACALSAVLAALVLLLFKVCGVPVSDL